MNTKGFKLGTVILIILFTSIISAVATGVIMNNNYKGRSGLSYSQIMNDEYLSEFLSIYSGIKNNYYGEYDEVGMLSAAASAMVSYKGDDKKEAMDDAMDAMLNYLGDSYTKFLNNSEYDYLSDELSGKHKGIGVTITGNEVIDITKNSPAEKAGIKKGDIIINVNDQKITEDNSYFISYIITNDDSDKVDITILRDSKEITFEIEKGLLDFSTKHFMVNETNIGYISLSVFSKGCSDSFYEALTDLENKGMTSLIIDLRDNGGGYLTEAVDIASYFLKKGDVVNSLLSNEGKKYNYDETKESRDYEIVILINGDTASASEILTAALKDNGAAKVVGEKSYGKGTVQQLIESNSGVAAKYTTAHWYTPNEICINKIGINPDYNIEIEKKKNENGEVIEIIDAQYNKALEILKGK